MVIHNGTMNGGHYVSIVKSKEKYLEFFFFKSLDFLAKKNNGFGLAIRK